MTTGSYLTVDELIALSSEEDLIALAGIGGFNSAGGRTLDRDRLSAQIRRAQSLIDAQVLNRFPGLVAVPCADMPASLKGAAADLVVYWLRDRVADRGAVDDVTRARYLDVIDFLKGIRDGKTDLGPGRDGLGGLPGGGAGQTDRIAGSFPAARAPSMLEGWR